MYICADRSRPRTFPGTIAEQAKKYGVSMKEAASSIDWAGRGKKLEKLGDKLGDMAEKAHAKASTWCCCGTVDRESEITLQPPAGTKAK